MANCVKNVKKNNVQKISSEAFGRRATPRHCPSWRRKKGVGRIVSEHRPCDAKHILPGQVVVVAAPFAGGGHVQK